MPIDHDNFENFFIGQSAEALVASRFAMGGFECNKISPDSGVDYLITNIARQRVLKEDAISVELPVKSTVMRNSREEQGVTGDAIFWMAEEERDHLSADPGRVTAFVAFHSMCQIGDPDSFNYQSNIDRQIEQDAITYYDQELAKHGRSKRDGVQLSVLRINRFGTECFWLNGRQLARTADDGLWGTGNNGLRFLKAAFRDGRLALGQMGMVPESRELIYMLGCASADRFAEGRYSYDHL